MTERSRQLYIIFSEPTGTAEARAAIRPAHLAYVADLERRGVLFAAGPFTDETGRAQGPGMLIGPAPPGAGPPPTPAADPFHKNGFPTSRIQPWRLREGS